MLKWLIRRRVAAFERDYGYDSSYIYDMLDVSLRAVLAFNRIMPMSRYRHDVPKEAWYAAKIATAQSEDCGPVAADWSAKTTVSHTDEDEYI